MKIIEERNNQDPKANWNEYDPRPRTDNAAKTLIARLRRIAIKDKSIIQDMQYRIRTINVGGS